jgi:NAD(P)-dependent dehydrogenase (short-subunit alcohol dehydrogenase family)
MRIMNSHKPWVAVATLAIGFAALASAPPAQADTVLITGANSGIGLELARQYAAKGWTVIATHRRSSVPDTLAELKAEHGDNVRIERLDVTSAEEARALAAALEGVPVDVLVNNAGVYNDRRNCTDDDCPGDWDTQTFGQLDYGLLETIMAVNVKGPLLVSETLLPNVRASGRKLIVSISSTNGSLTEQLFGSGNIFYRASKAALNRSMQLVASELRDEGVTVLLMHPGAVLTERQAHLEGFRGMIETPFAVERMIATLDGVTLEDSGRFIQYDGSTVPW